MSPIEPTRADSAAFRFYDDADPTEPENEIFVDELALEPCIDGDVSPDGTAIGSVDAEPVIKIVHDAR